MLLVHILIALVVFGLLCKYVYLLAYAGMDHLGELKGMQLNKQLSLFALAILRNLKPTTAVSKLSPACLLVPRSGCAVPAAEWMMMIFTLFIDGWKHLFWQLNAVMKMLLFQRKFSEVPHCLL